MEWQKEGWMSASGLFWRAKFHPKKRILVFSDLAKTRIAFLNEEEAKKAYYAVLHGHAQIIDAICLTQGEMRIEM